jgi:hypothetical protein
MGMYLFALVMIVLNIAAFGVGMSKCQPERAEVAMGASAERSTGISGRIALGASSIRR